MRSVIVVTFRTRKASVPVWVGRSFWLRVVWWRFSVLRERYAMLQRQKPYTQSRGNLRQPQCLLRHCIHTLNVCRTFQRGGKIRVLYLLGSKTTFCKRSRTRACLTCASPSEYASSTVILAVYTLSKAIMYFSTSQHTAECLFVETLACFFTSLWIFQTIK